LQQIINKNTMELKKIILSGLCFVAFALHSQEQNFDTYRLGDVEFKMIYVKGGTFEMGETENYPELDRDDPTTCMVTLSDYYIGETEVTQALWFEVMGKCPSFFQGDDMLPMENVSWQDCITFINKLNDLIGSDFRLPTEAEWEFAARGGTLSHGYGWSGSDNADEVAWYDNNSSGKTHPVKTKAPNELGIYDMSGNVWEWCEDRYSDYTSTPKTNPKGAKSGTLRVDRGGSWYNQRRKVCITHRGIYSSNFKNKFTGLRLATSTPMAL